MAEENKLEPEFLWLALKKILRVLKVFRGPVLLKESAIQVFTEVDFSLLENKNQRVLSMKRAKDLVLY